MVLMTLDAETDVIGDARPLSATILATWWQYVGEKKNSKRQEVLDSLRDAASKWPTIGLLSAFSETIKPKVNYADEFPQPDSIADTWTQGNELAQSRQDEPQYFDVLQLLAQDEAGPASLKASLQTTLQVTYESQPHLSVPDARFAAQKFSTEKAATKNLLRIYCTNLTPLISRYPEPDKAGQQSNNNSSNALYDNNVNISHATPASTVLTAEVNHKSTHSGRKRKIVSLPRLLLFLSLSPSPKKRFRTPP